MPNRSEQHASTAFQIDVPGVWAKKFFFASSAVMEAVLRPYDLGKTQWYVLFRLSTAGSLAQRELTRELEVERATLSAVVAALVRKGLIEQTPDPEDSRQKLLSTTPAGDELWRALPDPRAVIAEVAFAGEDPADLDVMNRMLSNATARLVTYRKGLS